MPGVLLFHLGDPTRGRVEPKATQLHGMVSTLLAETDFEHRSDHKPWSAAVTRESRERIEVRVGWLDVRPPEGRVTAAVRLGPGTYPVLAQRWRPVTFDQLAAHPCDEVGLEFMTPTWFSRSGQSLPFPTPALTFARLADRWNQHCEPAQVIPRSLRSALLDSLVLTAWSGETWRMDFGRGVRTGFVGRVVAALDAASQTAGAGAAIAAAEGNRESAPMAELLPSVLGALAGFAELSGVGAQTTYGAGRVRVVR